MNSVKITKLPRYQNENNIVFNEAYEFSKNCPYCHDDDYTVWNDTKTWEGTQDMLPWWKALSKEKHKWKVLMFICNKCGAEWESEPFRYDYPDDVIMREIKEK